ncbi:glycerophosphodiester phosphodiesterase [Rubrobacter indicoceani]|uniref:glycerophosphodiester phosphodiesterase n=1 Tax=Rubrobacter indicoceani TaxID=2051957 RepID=UPI0013C52ACF|nr:glycerophosphodiester phosphodiesterase [Rubrobacter indicoceani]
MKNSERRRGEGRGRNETLVGVTGRQDGGPTVRETLLFAGALLAGVVLVVRFLNARRAGKGRGRVRGGSPVVGYAHRGGATNAPENTLVAFARGLSEGADALEMDVHLTRDGELVVIHDENVERTTEGFGRVSEMDYSDLSRLDAGYRFEGEGRYPYRGRGIRVPSFGEVLRSFPEARVNVEVKSDAAEARRRMARLIKGCGAEGRVTVASSGHRRMLRLRKEIPGVATSASLIEVAVFHFAARLGLEAFVPTPYVALQVPVRYRGMEVVTPGLVEAAHSRGVRVDVWTVDEEEEISRLVDLGVDGIMTDRPDLLRSVLDGRPPGKTVD